MRHAEIVALMKESCGRLLVWACVFAGLCERKSHLP